MKKTLVSLLVASMLAGCSTLDNQDASKTEKTGEAAGVGAIAGAIAGRLVGIGAGTGAALGAALGGGFEWMHETDRELKAANDKVLELQKQKISAKANSEMVKVNNQDVTRLRSFAVESLKPAAIVAVAGQANESKFGGQIVVVSQKGKIPMVKSEMTDSLVRTDIKTLYITPDVARKAGFDAKEGVAWVPAYPNTTAGAGV